MSDEPLTRREADTLAFIEVFGWARGRYPSIKEISVGMRFKKINGVQQLLRGLRRKGRMTWEDGKQRTLLVVDIAKGK